VLCELRADACDGVFGNRFHAAIRTPIISLQYFSDIIKKVTELAIPESYWEPLRSKMMRMEQQW
jgi:hypothetical protein